MSSRRKLNQVDAEVLKQSVLQYSEAKGEESSLKKVITKLGTQIKNDMQSLKLDELVVGSVKASISITVKEDFNELQAIEILREKLTPEQFSDVVKSREYIDDDAFERLIYNDDVDAAILNPCRTPKDPTVTLRLGKAK